MLVVEDGGELCAEEQDQTRNIAPRENSDDSADRSIDLIVVKVVKAQGEDILRDFPQQARKKRARQSISQSDFRLRHKAVDEDKERHRDQITQCRKQDLPERAAH